MKAKKILLMMFAFVFSFSLVFVSGCSLFRPDDTPPNNITPGGDPPKDPPIIQPIPDPKNVGFTAYFGTTMQVTKTLNSVTDVDGETRDFETIINRQI